VERGGTGAVRSTGRVSTKGSYDSSLTVMRQSGSPTPPSPKAEKVSIPNDPATDYRDSGGRGQEITLEDQSRFEHKDKQKPRSLG